MYIELMKEMFSEMVLKKNAALIPFYYHPEMLLFSNGHIIGYDEFLSSHQEYYASQKQYSIEYDETSFLEQGERAACRMWITVSLPDEQPKKMEVILIGQYKDGKIYRVWELTYPDWSKLPEFSER